ncbi:MAG TPA: type II toxin-antitoxin system VapB family antitoxin [Azospirillaceae bacterium]|nr:type II toxin-antitoxin system VapB family antitoxin [Azospirillaceae bacterium]
MSLTIKSDEAERLAQELCSLTGESVEDAVTRALADRIARQREVERKRKAFEEARKAISALPVLDGRSDDEIIGYNDIGAFD